MYHYDGSYNVALVLDVEDPSAKLTLLKMITVQTNAEARALHRMQISLDEVDHIPHIPRIPDMLLSFVRDCI